MLENRLKPNNRASLIALVGAGGKTTTMLHLANYFKQLDMRVLVTTTTRIFVPEKDQYDQFVLHENPSFNKEDIESGTIVLAGKGMDEKNKIIGLDSKTINEIYLNAIFDLILVEADGSKRKPIKAPENHEPVIPQNATHVIGVIGLDSLGGKVNTETVHRLEAFKNVTGAKEDDIIDETMVVALINHTEGLFKNAPKRAKKMVLLNKAINETLIQKGNQIKDYLKNTELEVFIRGRYDD